FMLARMLWSVPFRLGWMFLGARLEGQVDWGTRLIADNVAEFRAAALAQPAGAARLRAVLHEATRLLRILPQLPPRLSAGLMSLGRLRRRFAGTELAADVELLQRGLVGNVTTEMDLAVGDLADLVRPHPQLLAALQQPN